MTTSFTHTDEHIESLKAAAARLLSSKVQSLDEVIGGRNSQVYRLVVEPLRSYALKAYFRHVSDSRTRMETEFGALSFLWDNGVRNIPKPLIASQEFSIAIYEWIEGRRIEPHDVTRASIQAAASFLICLAELRNRPSSQSLGPASEAYFSGRAILENLQRRLDPLMTRTDADKLQGFLAGEYLPAYKRITDLSQRRAGNKFDIELSLKERTLSPSDFGFHNALQREDGEIYFLDLEYFGWDDPAKTISDFLLHPAMDLSPFFKRQFVASVIQDFSCASLPNRLKAFYPLFGLKWCLILLNEFLPEQLLRRRFAGVSDRDQQQKQAEQLAKAENMLQRTLKEYEHFPYLD